MPIGYTQINLYLILTNGYLVKKKLLDGEMISVLGEMVSVLGEMDSILGEMVSVLSEMVNILG